MDQFEQRVALGGHFIFFGVANYLPPVRRKPVAIALDLIFPGTVRGSAQGALEAAKWLTGKRGWFTIDDMLAGA